MTPNSKPKPWTLHPRP